VLEDLFDDLLILDEGYNTHRSLWQWEMVFK
jgi:hypothetical protein